MEPQAYRIMAENEDRHWWYAGRRAIADRVIRSLGLGNGAQILEIGAGTGGNLAMLAAHGTVSAVEPDGCARAWARRKTSVPVLEGHLPGGLPFSPASYDLVCLFDVLEHVREDTASLRNIRRLLKQGGRVLLTVPAHPWLWSVHDEMMHHVRRYSRAGLRQAVRQAGYRIQRMSYFNSTLFLLLAATRLLDRLRRRRQATGLGVPHPAVNAALRAVFSAEKHLVARTGLPFGVSLLAILEPEAET